MEISAELVPGISHSIKLKLEYASNAEDLKDLWSFVNKLMKRIDQLEKKQPQLKRVRIPLLDRIQLNNSTPTYQIPIQVPKNSVSVILRCKSFIGNSSGHSYLTFEAQQQANSNGILTVDKYHFDWYYNNTVEEFIMPWNGQSENQTLEIRVKSSLSDGNYNGENQNYFTISIEGFMEF
ncbi:predicted protein [Naegleria gruberi]|uniref:Predicted protein n=1 Tax=Naegleria gruberi TaxID=5762 RepID=D2VT23_NAEGR|nr:uncharacterized protein NAEGRDRAFT_72147 [Naegleria gruberi]EFC40009.1 predicted protein [Naegleria gruberi]|eukprot:XP_002672753.1 predicted protein [Naegleria gruberi strain NEG-M]